MNLTVYDIMALLCILGASFVIHWGIWRYFCLETAHEVYARIVQDELEKLKGKK